jgi:hypothetical protein
MIYELTRAEKIDIIRGQIRQITYNKYSSEVQLIVENSITNPNETRISEINADIANRQAQIDALMSEIEGLPE